MTVPIYYTLYCDEYNQSVTFSADPLVMYGRLESYQRYGPLDLCDVGHQGLLHDREFGLVYNRMRYLHPTLGRFLQRDPLMYIDGMSVYEYVRSSPTDILDFFGLGVTAKWCNNLTKDQMDALLEFLQSQENDRYRIGIYRSGDGGLYEHTILQLLGPDGKYHVYEMMPTSSMWHVWGHIRYSTYPTSQNVQGRYPTQTSFGRTEVDGETAKKIVERWKSMDGNVVFQITGVYDCRHYAYWEYQIWIPDNSPTCNWNVP